MRLWPVGTLVAILLLAGCGGGDTLPLQPANGTCDRPPDPRWRLLAPLRGDQQYCDAVWQDQETVWVVGTGGLALVKRGDGPFRPEETGTTGNLEAVAALADGVVAAVGQDGIVAEHAAGRWTVHQVAGTGTLRRAAALGDLVWAVGDSGAVVQRDAAGAWTRLDFPGTGDLDDVAAKADTVAVCGTGGALWLGTPDGWLNLSTGPWLTDDLHSVVWLADGRLAVGGRLGLFVRGPSGWAAPLFAEDPGQDYFVRLEAAGRQLWYFGSRDLLVVDTGDPVWTFDRIFYSYYRTVAVRDETSALLVTSTSLRWYADGVLGPPDPAGYDGDDLFALADGTTGCFDSWGLMVPGPAGLRREVLLPADVREALGFIYCVTGQSLDDFYVGDREAVWGISGGVGSPLVEIPSGSYLNSLVQDRDGRLHLSLDGPLHGLFTVEGGVLQPLLVQDEGYGGPELSLTRQGTAIAQRYSAVWVFHDAGWDSLAFRAGDFLAEPAPGQLLSLHLGSLNGYQIWREGQGLLVEEEFDPMPLCPGLDFRGAADGEAGPFIYTRYPSLVLAPQTERVDGPWDLVAGPMEGEIRDLKVQADGSLLAATWNPQALVIYPAR